MPITYDVSAAGTPRQLQRQYRSYEDGELEGFDRLARPGQATGRWGNTPDPMHEARVASAAELVSDMLNARAPSWALKEAIQPTHMATARAIESNYPGLFRLEEAYGVSDFPNLLGDVLDRMMLQRFREFPQGWRRWCRVSRPLRDFRTVRRLALNGAEGQYQQVDDQEGIQYSQTLAEDNYTYSPDLYALGVKLSFRDIMNDDLDAFDSIPDRLGRGGRRTIAKFATELLFDASGPHASLFTAGNGNLLTNNPDLAIDSLGTAFETLLGFTDDDSEPILVEGVALVYPPALHVTVQNMLNQLTVDVAEEGGTSNQTVRVNNWIVRDIEAVMDPYIPIVASSSNGDTSWALISRPTAGRPIAEVGFLAGFDEPQLFRKASNTVRVGGGQDQMLGDFETMQQHYKGVLGLGGAQMEPQSAVASNGSNS
jgi:hypothetical protein